MSDVAHVPAQRIQLENGHSLDEVFASAVKRGGAQAAPPASKPLVRNEVRSPEELQAVIDEAGVSYEECGQLSVALNWWNRTSSDSSWQVGKPGGNIAS